MSNDVLKRARKLATEMLSEKVAPIAGFGDYYPGNILTARGSWTLPGNRTAAQSVAVDAQRYWGDPAFDAGNACYGLGFMYGFSLDETAPQFVAGSDDAFLERLRGWASVIGVTGYAMHSGYGHNWDHEVSFLQPVAEDQLGVHLAAGN